MSLPDVNSICLNGVQKYNAYISLSFSRKNRSYWPMCHKTQIFHILEKYGSFSKLNFPPDRSICVRMRIPVSLESASGFPKKPSYYNLKTSIFKFSPNIPVCSQNESLLKCPQKSRKIFKTEIFKSYYDGFVGNPGADF